MKKKRNRRSNSRTRAVSKVLNHVVSDGDSPAELRLYQELAKQGDPVAQHNRGLMNLEGRGLPQDDQAAAKWLRQAATGGLASARSVLDQLRLSGRVAFGEESEAKK
ncbi:MAG: hypothetical protein LBR53_08835 [Deltaproteobacteria bacterium]|nr:hypothetical protein [Deltaproteobacteria bacterium]